MLDDPNEAVALIAVFSSVSIVASADVAPAALDTLIPDIADRPPAPAFLNCAPTFRSLAPAFVKVNVPGFVPSSEKSTVRPAMPSLSIEFFNPTATMSETEVALASAADTV